MCIALTSPSLLSDFPIEVLNALSSTDLECVINVYIALAKCLANIHKAAESVAAYQNALRVSATQSTLMIISVYHDFSDDRFISTDYSGKRRFGNLGRSLDLISHLQRIIRGS